MTSGGSGTTTKKAGKIAQGRAAMQHTLTRLQLSVRQSRADVVSRLRQSRSGVTSMGKKMVRGVRSRLTRLRATNEPSSFANGSEGYQGTATAQPDHPLAASVLESATSTSATTTAQVRCYGLLLLRFSR